MKHAVNKYLDSAKYAIDMLDINEINNFINVLINVYEKGNNIYIFGNGGSASTASHFACDFNKGINCDLLKKFKVVSLNDNIPTMLAYANDVDYDAVFIEQLKNFLKKDDVVIGISGSGNSKNILKAIEFANQKNNPTIGITGFDGGHLKKIAKYSVNVNVDNMQITEDLHLMITHLTMTALNNYILNDKKVLAENGICY